MVKVLPLPLLFSLLSSLLHAENVKHENMATIAIDKYLIVFMFLLIYFVFTFFDIFYRFDLLDTYPYLLESYLHPRKKDNCVE